MAGKPSPLQLRALVALAAASLSCVAFARQPIAVLDVLQQSDNANTTSFVLYDDGLVIYASKSPDSLHPYLFANLTRSELQKIAPPSALLSLKREYITFNASDVPLYRLLFTASGQRSGVRILGFLRQTGDWHPGELTPLPSALDSYIGNIVNFSNPRAEPWQPPSIEVEISPESAKPVAKWPQNWPSLNSATKVKFDPPGLGPDWYCIRLPGKDLIALHHFAESLGSDGTFAMNGKTWGIVHTRFVLPEEDRWHPIGACHPDL